MKAEDCNVVFNCAENIVLIFSLSCRLHETFRTIGLSRPNFDIEVNTAAQGSYTVGFNSYSFDDGSLSIVDLGNNKFKLTFNNVNGTNLFDDSLQKTITGYCEGVFVEEE